jgi:hypothetical protein
MVSEPVPSVTLTGFVRILTVYTLIAGKESEYFGKDRYQVPVRMVPFFTMSLKRGI